MQLPVDVQGNMPQNKEAEIESNSTNDARYRELAKKLGVETVAAETWGESIGNFVSYTGLVITGKFITERFAALEDTVRCGFVSLLERFFVQNPKWQYLQLSIPYETKRDSPTFYIQLRNVKCTKILLDNTMSTGHSGCYEVLLANTQITDDDIDANYLIGKCKSALKARKYEIFKCTYAFTPKFKRRSIFDHFDFVQAVGDGSDYKFADIIFNELKRAFGENVYADIAQCAMSENQVRVLEYLVLLSTDQDNQLKYLILLTLNLYSNSLKSYYKDPDSFRNIAVILQNITKSLHSLLEMPPFKLLSQADKLTLIKRAIRKTQVENLRLLITYAEIDLNQKIDESYLLEDCIKSSTPEVIHQLILSGASVAKIPSALYLVARRPVPNEQEKLNIIKIAQCLIQEEASVNGVESEKESPLHAAIRSGHLALVKLFLEHKDINLDLRDENGKTALEIAEGLAKDPNVRDEAKTTLRNNIYFEVRYAQKAKRGAKQISEATHSIIFANNSYPVPAIPVVVQQPQVRNDVDKRYSQYQ